MNNKPYHEQVIMAFKLLFAFFGEEFDELLIRAKVNNNFFGAFERKLPWGFSNDSPASAYLGLLG